MQGISGREPSVMEGSIPFGGHSPIFPSDLYSTHKTDVGSNKVKNKSSRMPISEVFFFKMIH